MNDAEIKEVIRKMREVTKRIIAEGRAQEFLVRLGTHTPEGELTPEYGGPKCTRGEK